MYTVDGVWSGWGSWGECSIICGLGTARRQRTCNNPPPVNGGKDCKGEADGVKPCELIKCPG